MAENLRVIHVGRDRLAGWVDRFISRHGITEAPDLRDITTQPDRVAQSVILTGTDGATAEIGVPFAPLAVVEPQRTVTALLTHVATDRPVGALLVRRRGFAVGRFRGAELLESKVGSSYVQGKTKAGGWSQQRYARRRANQSQQAYAEAADVAHRLLTPLADALVAVVTGGDTSAVTAVLSDPRLGSVAALAGGRVYPTADPRLRVLQAFPAQFLAVEIRLNHLA